MPLEWHGKRVKSNLHSAAKTAINATMQACVLHAKDNHGAGAHALGRFVSRTAEAERSIRVIEEAQRVRGGVAGRWGSVGIDYFRRLELGFQGQDSAGRVVNAPAYPALLPAADEQYPKLRGRIDRARRKQLRALRSGGST